LNDNKNRNINTFQYARILAKCPLKHCSFVATLDHQKTTT